MLRNLVPEAPTGKRTAGVPRIIRPLVDAGSCPEAITQALLHVARSLGFDAFMYGVSTKIRPSLEARSYVWTSLPADWVKLYDQRAYLEIDPRLQQLTTSILPVIWDRAAFPDTPTNREFFDAAARYGNCSGVAVPLRNVCHAPALFVLNSSLPAVDDARRARIADSLSDILLVASCVHELFLASVIDRCIPPPTEGRPMSKRERECLQLAARGMTSIQIGNALGIGERTVHQHFSNLLSKLGATNRHEALAKAMAAGLIES